MNQKIPARLFLLSLTTIAVTIFTGCDRKEPGASSGPGKKKLAYVTNGVDPFWNT